MQHLYDNGNPYFNSRSVLALRIANDAPQPSAAHHSAVKLSAIPAGPLR